MSVVLYSALTPGFIDLLVRNSAVFTQSSSGAVIDIKAEGSGKLLGLVQFTVDSGNLTSLKFLNTSLNICGTVTGLRVDAREFAVALDSAQTPEERLKVLVTLVDDATRLTGSAGNDPIEVGAGRDTVNALGGNDDIAKWKSGNLTLDGGAGIDTLSFQSRAGAAYPTAFRQRLDIDLRNGAGDNPYGGTLKLSKVENIVGTSQADRIVGNGSANRIGDGVFDGGADTINTLGGNDIVFLSAASAGAKVAGGDGRDELRFAIDTPASGGTVLDLLNPAANFGVFKGSAVTGFEVFSVFQTAVTLSRFTFRGSNSGETVTGSLFVPGTAIENGRDTLIGRGGDDTLNGLSGRDFLDGGIGRDQLDGGSSADFLRGGANADRLTGGLGPDTFDFDNIADIGKTVGARDIVTDFSHAQKDRIDLQNIDADGTAAGNQAFRFIGAAAFGDNPGELHFVRQNVPGTANDRTYIEGDINGDGTADFRLELDGLPALFRADFIL